jgi:hypothetical protein
VLKSLQITLCKQSYFLSANLNPHFHFQEAAANGLREALRSFCCHFTRKVNEPADTPGQSIGFKMSLQMDKHSVGTSPQMQNGPFRAVQR